MTAPRATATTRTPRAAPPNAPKAVLTKVALEDLYRSVNGKFGDAAELRLEAGREMLQVLFGNDARVALSNAAESHAPWIAFRKLAGGRKLRPLRRQIRLALRLAAWERIVDGGFYTHLDPSLREELLALDDADAIRDAAQHCIENNWGQRALRKHVKTLLAKAGKGRTTTSAVRARAAVKPLEQVATALASDDDVEAVAKAVRKLPEDERTKALEAIERAHARLAALKKALK